MSSDTASRGENPLDTGNLMFKVVCVYMYINRDKHYKKYKNKSKV